MLVYFFFSQKTFTDTDNPSEAFTNAVILGHCCTLSDCGADWSTVLPLRHLQMTLIKITSDLCRYLRLWAVILGYLNDLEELNVS